MNYIIGIDLGTTNSCIAYVDTRDGKGTVQVFKVPQLVAEGVVDSINTLPSFCYLSAAYEWSKNSTHLPWQHQADYFVGTFARDQGAKVPTKLVQSAKSWLCHAAANRREKILPLEAAAIEMRISPVEAATRYLRHIRDAWNEVMGKGDPESEFDSQEVVLTVPASFDEVARTLTVEAAKAAGIKTLTLLEEPQAAFYSWIAQHEEQWQKILKPGDCIFVCDVGGGTTDFSLIDVVEKGQKVAFERMAVGNHLLLGGDNMDAAVAHFIEEKIAARGEVLKEQQKMQLLHVARETKEVLLEVHKGKNAPKESHRIILQGAGSSVIQGTISLEVTKSELQQFLLDGFFGNYSWQEALNHNKTSGLRTMGLPYEDEPSIVKHIAAFLSSSGGKAPDFVMFNGGAMKPIVFQEAVIEAMHRWFPEKKLTVLPSYNLDLAVARGAAYYGKVRRGMGVKIGGGVPRTYYLILNVDDRKGNVTKKALAVLPRGSEEGQSFETDKTFMLQPNTPISFQLCTSHVRLHDKAGDLVDIDPEEIHLLPPISTVLRFGKRQAADASQEETPVHLYITLTPIGTLEISLKAVHTEHRWALEFQTRSASGQDNSMAVIAKQQSDQTFDQSLLKAGEALIDQVYRRDRDDLRPDRLVEKLEEIFGLSRKEWPPSVMRRLADVLIKAAPFRNISADYTSRWWNLVGFLLRPGFGYPLDDFRIKELWKVILGDFRSSLPSEVQLQMWICYRRIAGGLTKGQQQQLANELIGQVISKKSGKIETRSKAEIYPMSEKIRTLGSFEWIDIGLKARVADALITRIIAGEGNSADYWALGRIGARQLFYGSLGNVIPRDQCQQWTEKLLGSTVPKGEQQALLFAQLARKTTHREVNVSREIADKIIAHFAGTSFLEKLQHQLLTENSFTAAEQEIAFGESLPVGLKIFSD